MSKVKTAEKLDRLIDALVHNPDFENSELDFEPGTVEVVLYLVESGQSSPKVVCRLSPGWQQILIEVKKPTKTS